MRREGVDAAGHPVVEAGAHRHQHVGVVHGHVRVVRAVHAEHLEAERMGGRKGPQAHQGGGDRDLGQLGQLPQLGVGVGGDDAAAHVEHRPLGAHHGPRRPLDLTRMAVVVRVVGAHRDLLGPDELRLLHQDVLGQVDVHRPRPPADGDVKRLPDDRPQILAVLDQEVVLGGRARDADVIGLLEGVVADQVRGHLPGERDDRDRVHEGVLQRGHEIGAGGPRRHQAHAHLAGRPRVALGGVAGGRLLADEDVAQPLEVVQRVVDRQHGAAGQAEDEVDTLALQTLQHDSRPWQFHSTISYVLGAPSAEASRSLMRAWAALRRAMGIMNGEHDT